MEAKPPCPHRLENVQRARTERQALQRGLRPDADHPGRMSGHGTGTSEQPEACRCTPVQEEAKTSQVEQLTKEVAELSTAKAAKEATIDTIKTVGVHVVDAITGKTKRKEEDLRDEILRLKNELAKKGSRDIQNKERGSGSLKSGHKPIRKQSVRPPAGQATGGTMEKAAEANAERWRNRFFSLWPDAAGRHRGDCQAVYHDDPSQPHTSPPSRRPCNARSMEDAEEYATDLWDMAKDEMVRHHPKGGQEEKDTCSGG